jgi:dienelactone hydrolase
MVFEVQRFSREQVREVILEEPPFREYLTRSKDLAEDDLEGRLALAEWCKERKLKEERLLELARVLEADPENAAALKAYGASKWKKLARGHPDLDPAVRAAVDEYLEIRDPEERARAYGKLKRELVVSVPREYLDRIIRSRDRKKGLTQDHPLSLRATESPGAVYTIYVPKSYDPRRAWPLVLGLHGGGVGGKDRRAVVGSGRDAMNFYVRQAAARGYIVVCPSAMVGGWSGTPNEVLLEAVLQEIPLLYHVDLNRVYLTGHSMGGGGTWHYGPKWAERFAAVSPMAGWGGGGIGRLVSTNTPIFIFHGSDDPRVGVGSDRASARSLAKTKHDYIYTELDGVGHGFPASIQEDLFDFFDTRRLARMRGGRGGPPSASVRSSFVAKVSREEKRFLGDPLEYGATGEGDRVEWKRLLKDVRLGGGKAEAAANRLGEIKAKDSVKPLAGLLRHPELADDVKVHAARALGMIGDPAAYSGLAAGLRSESHEVFKASARAMAAVRAPKSGEALVGSLKHLAKVLDGRRLGPARIGIIDWERWLGAFTAAVEGIGEVKPEGAAAAIHKIPVEQIVCAEWNVLHDPGVRQDPARARRALALAVVDALVALADPAGRAALEEMRSARSDDPKIVAACTKALAE